MCWRFCLRLAAGYPRAIHYHLGSAFVETLESQHEKIAASGMDLGSRTLFGTRLGFSGTPNDLLPLAMGACVPEPGSAAKTVLILTDPARPAQEASFASRPVRCAVSTPPVNPGSVYRCGKSRKGACNPRSQNDVLLAEPDGRGARGG